MSQTRKAKFTPKVGLVHTGRTLFALAGLLFVNGCGTLSSAHPREGAGLSVDDDGVAYVRVGTRVPVVVLQAGHQDGKKTWGKLVADLALQNMVIATDRPGHGGNPATDAPRDPCTIAGEQHKMLQIAGAPPPYILVGHSLGGLYQYAYAKLYPSDVAGIVLLDPTHPRHWETMQREFPRGADLIKLMRLVAFSSVDKKEFDAQAEYLNKLNLAQPLSIPAKLLVSGRFRPEERGKFENMLKPLRQDWLQLLGAKRMQVVWDSGHYIQKDSPEEVVSAVQQLISEIDLR